MRILGLAAVFIGVISSALAQEPAAAPETVTVEAQRHRKLIEQEVSAFVSGITVANREEAMLRWHRPVCPAIVGLTPAQNQFMLARLSQAVTDAGAPLAPENCAPNFLVLATQQPEAVLQKWWDRNPRMFNTDKGMGGIKPVKHPSGPGTTPSWVVSRERPACGAARPTHQRIARVD
jgi:hypothetical protein